MRSDPSAWQTRARGHSTLLVVNRPRAFLRIGCGGLLWESESGGRKTPNTL